MLVVISTIETFPNLQSRTRKGRALRKIMTMKIHCYGRRKLNGLKQEIWNIPKD